MIQPNTEPEQKMTKNKCKTKYYYEFTCIAKKFEILSNTKFVENKIAIQKIENKAWHHNTKEINDVQKEV